MSLRAVVWGALAAWLAAGAPPARAQHHGHFGHFHHHGGYGRLSPGLLAWGGGYGAYYYSAYGIGPGGVLPFIGPILPIQPFPLILDRGVPLAGPMPNFPLRRLPVQAPPAPAKKADPARAEHLMTLGDRLFRAGNTKRAEERYNQALKSDPDSAGPRVRLAQLALVRGQYAEAANQFREAQTAEPGWLVKAKDVQALFPEPTDFARHIARLEAHLQAEPTDRDAWLVLGAEWFLSGRTRKAADVFLRLSDRRPDATLAAFLDATTTRER